MLSSENWGKASVWFSWRAHLPDYRNLSDLRDGCGKSLESKLRERPGNSVDMPEASMAFMPEATMTLMAEARMTLMAEASMAIIRAFCLWFFSVSL